MKQLADSRRAHGGPDEAAEVRVAGERRYPAQHLQMFLGGEATVSEVASRVGIKEQAAYVIVRELVEKKYLIKEEVGRRNRYRVNWARTFDREALGKVTLGAMVQSVAALAAAMTPAKTRVLLHLAEHPQSTAEMIADAVDISATEVSVALDELEQEKIVSQGQVEAGDGYVVTSDFLPGKGGLLSMKEQVRLALETKPQLPDLAETLNRDLEFLERLSNT